MKTSGAGETSARTSVDGEPGERPDEPRVRDRGERSVEDVAVRHPLDFAGDRETRHRVPRETGGRVARHAEREGPRRLRGERRGHVAADHERPVVGRRLPVVGSERQGSVGEEVDVNSHEVPELRAGHAVHAHRDGLDLLRRGREVRAARDPVRSRGVAFELEGRAVQRDPAPHAHALRHAVRERQPEQPVAEAHRAELAVLEEEVPAGRASRAVVPKLEILVSAVSGIPLEAEVLRVGQGGDETARDGDDDAREVDRRRRRVAVHVRGLDGRIGRRERARRGRARRDETQRLVRALA